MKWTVDTPFNIHLEFYLANVYKRALATMIDWGLMVAYFLLTFYVLGDRAEVWGREYPAVAILLRMLCTLPAAAYPLVAEWLTQGRTVGKYLLSIKVMDMEGGPASLHQCLLRYFLGLRNYAVLSLMALSYVHELWYVFFITIFASIPDIIVMGISKYGQRLGDLAAGTVVVYTKYSMDIQATVYKELDRGSYVPSYPEVLKLSDKDLHRIKDLLGAKKTKSWERYMIQLAYKVERVIDVKMEGDPMVFLHTLLSDYNYFSMNKGADAKE